MEMFLNKHSVEEFFEKESNTCESISHSISKGFEKRNLIFLLLLLVERATLY